MSLTFPSISRHLWDWHPNYWDVNSFLKRKMGCTFKLVGQASSVLGLGVNAMSELHRVSP